MHKKRKIIELSDDYDIDEIFNELKHTKVKNSKVDDIDELKCRISILEKNSLDINMLEEKYDNLLDAYNILVDHFMIGIKESTAIMRHTKKQKETSLITHHKKDTIKDTKKKIEWIKTKPKIDITVSSSLDHPSEKDDTEDDTGNICEDHDDGSVTKYMYDDISSSDVSEMMNMGSYEPWTEMSDLEYEKMIGDGQP